MTDATRNLLLYALIGLIGLLAPYLAPAFRVQMALLWMMILFALTWDLGGGQMGYNSFGNIVFFGIGCYVAAVVQRDLFFAVGGQPQATGDLATTSPLFNYFNGFAVGLALAVIIALAVAAALGSGILGLRGHYFAICTLGVGVAAGEIASGWDYIGAGSGIDRKSVV